MAAQPPMTPVFNRGPARPWMALCLGLLIPLLGLSACDETAAAGVESVKLGDRWFHLEVADTAAKRFQGLSGRTEIAPDGGMLFLMPNAGRLNYVMRDCPIPIDIIFVDPSGRIVAMHEMLPEPPRSPDEPKTDDPALDKYENRLVRYPSRFAAQFVIELKGGTLDTLSLKVGDKLPLDIPRLKAMAR